VSNTEFKLNLSYPDGTAVGIITSDSLITPININRSGDKINIYTYSSEFTNEIREDFLIFGNLPGASVGEPVNDYSIMRNSWRYSSNTIAIDCLTENPSLGTPNDTTGLSATLKGVIYDTENNPVKGNKVFPASPSYFVLQAPIELDSTGNYTTRIFNTVYHPGSLTVRLIDFMGWERTQEINSFELQDIQPGTVIYQDIYLKSNDYVVTSVEDYELPLDEDITLINYPNPFNLSTTFFVKIPGNLSHKSKAIYIYNVTGELIKIIPIKGDTTNVRWDGTDSGGRIMASGIYYYRLNVDNIAIKSGSMILLK
jgi:hypothetical protein